MSTPDMLEIEEISTMRVARVTAEGESPEIGAFQALFDWSREHKNSVPERVRFFGFNDPCPEPGQTVYKYEAWMTVNDDAVGSETVTMNTHRGGRYAVLVTPLGEIEQAWERLVGMVRESSYRIGQGPALEEALSNPVETSFAQAVMKLYLPISEG